MAEKPHSAGRRRSQEDRGLLTEDHSEIKLVPAADRDWWNRLSEPARARFAEKRRKKWTDEETEHLILADPDRDDYFGLAAALGRSPGAVRTRRSQMIHLLRDEYGYVSKAKAYLDDPRTHHRFADIGQVYLTLERLGLFALPVHEQFGRARHLKQPSGSWRGDNSEAVLRDRRAREDAVRAQLAALKRSRTEEDAR